jgi:RNA polymerase sigma factor (sigma-70 family)
MDPNRLDEESLMRRFLEGDARAFQELYRLLSPMALSTAMLCGDRGFAEDIVSEKFTVVWQTRDRFKTLSDVKAFLFVIIRNACYDYLKMKNNMRPYEPAQLEVLLAGVAGDSEVHQISEELMQWLREAIVQLPEQMRKTLELTLQGLSVPEIAQQLGVTTRAVSNYRWRALEQLRPLIPWHLL